MTTLSDGTAKFLGNRLAAEGIRTAVVVDDVFDTPALPDLRNEVFEFWNAVERDVDLRDQLEAFGISVESEADISEELVAKLWSRRGESNCLVDLANRTLFPTVLSDLKEAEDIAESLHSLGLEVARVGMDSPVPIPVPSLVFMDYVLGHPLDDGSQKRSARRAREYYDAAGSGVPKPFIILMSSRSNLGSQADRFRENADLLGGMFDFVTKADLNDPIRFTIKMGTWATNMTLRHRIQNLIDTLETTLHASTQQFMQRVKSLTIEDYAFVQTLSLQDDGHPLGDYIQWLLGYLLVNKVLEDNDRFMASKSAINEISFDSQPLNPLFPSTHLAETYSLAVAEQKLGDIDLHPRVKEKAMEETGGADPERADKTSPHEDIPLLRLGDLLVNNDDQSVYMIATPDCDLQFAPGTRRVPDGGESVLLIPGQLLPLRERRVRRGHILTELYLHKGEHYRIAWDRKRIITVPIGMFFEWCSTQGYSRPARIRLPYAVKIQQEVIARFSRVGMPVAPPMQEYIPVDFLAECIEGTWEPLVYPGESDVAVIHGVTSEPKFVVTPATVNHLVDTMLLLKDRYRGLVDSSQGHRKQQMRSKLSRLEGSLRQPENLMKMLEKRWKLPRRGKTRQLVSDAIGLHRTGDFSNGCGYGHVVCLNIVYD